MWLVFLVCVPSVAEGLGLNWYLELGKAAAGRLQNLEQTAFACHPGCHTCSKLPQRLPPTYFFSLHAPSHPALQLGLNFPGTTPEGAQHVIDLSLYGEQELLAAGRDTYPLVVRLETVTDKGKREGHTLQELRCVASRRGAWSGVDAGHRASGEGVGAARPSLPPHHSPPHSPTPCCRPANPFSLAGLAASSSSGCRARPRLRCFTRRRMGRMWSAPPSKRSGWRA